MGGSVIQFPRKVPAAPIAYSYGVGASDNFPEQRTATTFAAFSEALFAQPGPAVPKGLDEKSMRRWKATAPLPWIAPPMGGDGRRSGANALPSSVLMLDVDGVRACGEKSAVDVLLECIEAIREIAPCFGYTTASHTVNRPGFPGGSFP